MSSSHSRIRFGILGAGRMGRTYAEIIAHRLENTALAGVACGSRAPDLGREYGVPCHASARELIGRTDIDAIVIATPQAVHAAQARAALAAGKHLLMEKPLATTVSDCDEIALICRNRGLKCTIGFAQRTRLCNMEAKALLDSGRLGRILHICSYLAMPQPLSSRPTWEFLPENIGFFLGYGVHNIDFIRWLTGREIASVFAKCRSLDPGLNVETTTDALLTMTDGTVAQLLVTFEMRPPGFPDINFTHHLICEHGLMDIAAARLNVSIAGGAWQTVAREPALDWKTAGILHPERLKWYEPIVADLADSILCNRSPVITVHDGRQAVAVALACYESHHQRREIFTQEMNGRKSLNHEK